MTRCRHDARTPRASGRFVLSVLAMAAGSMAGACASGGPRPEEDAVLAYPDPVLAPGRIAPSAEARAAVLAARADEALARGDVPLAVAAAREVVDSFPTAPVSGRTLWTLARATRAAGDLLEADAHAQRFARLLAPGDPRIVEVRLLQGRALVEAGEEESAVRRLLALPGDAPPVAHEEARALARAAVADLGAESLADLAGEVPTGHPFVPVLQAARARRLYNRGDDDEARREALRALESGAEGSDAAVAQGVLDLRVDEALGLTGPVAVLGGLFPTGGSPVLQEYARLVEEGVRAALAAAGMPGRLELAVMDGLGTPEGSAAAMVRLADSGALAVVGPLQADALGAAAAARPAPFPIISPTAPEVPSGEANVYTLLGPQPGAAEALATWAGGAGMRSVVLVHARDVASSAESEAFARVFGAAGGRVIRTFDYAPGATYFAELMRSAASLLPDAVVLTIPPADVEILAPQITFFGLDTLGIHVLGTGAWTDGEVLRVVSRRHLDGVIVSTPGRPVDGPSEGYRRFLRAYEATHRRTLRSPVPALGYDAAALLLAALATGARTPLAVARALEGLSGFDGATGTLSVRDGRVVREHTVVCLLDGRLLPAPPGQLPVVYDRRPPADALGGERSVPTGLPFVRVCPGETPPHDGVPVRIHFDRSRSPS